MTHLYTCKSISSVEYRVSKLDSDFNVLSSYVVTNGGCDCPQGNKPTCRHRKMLPEFAKHGHIDDGWFFNWDTRMWHKPLHQPALDEEALVSKLAPSLETELSPKAAAVHVSRPVLPSEAPAKSPVEHRAAPSDSLTHAGASTFPQSTRVSNPIKLAVMEAGMVDKPASTFKRRKVKS